MLLPLSLILLALAPVIRMTNVVPHAAHSARQSPAYVELHNAILNARTDIRPQGIHNRLEIPAHPLHERIDTPESAAAAVKRTLLGIRQSCTAGYGHCYCTSFEA